jgi:hypothetical protein
MQNLPPIYYIIFTAVTALGVLLQAFVLLAIFFAVRKAVGELREVAADVRSKAIPTIVSAKDLIEDISPKLKIATANLVEVSHTLRHQATHFNDTVESLLEKTSIQITRVDAIVTSAFDAVDHASRAIENAVAAPARRVSGVIQGLKTGVEVFLSKKPAPRETAEAAASSEKKPA